MHRFLAPLAAVAALCALSAAAPARADDAQPAIAATDGEPPAASGLRELTTDRPDVTESPFTVDAGHIQIEATLFGYTRGSRNASGEATDTYEFLTANLRVGLTDRVEIGIAWQPYRLLEPRGMGGGTASGAGDLELRAKLNLWGKDGLSRPGDTALALLPFVTFPREEPGTAGDPRFGVVVPFAVELGGGFGLGINAAAAISREPGGRLREASVLASASLGYAWDGRLASYGEVVWESGRGGKRGAVTLGTGVTFALGANWQLDAGMNVGLSPAADRLAPFLGLTARF